MLGIGLSLPGTLDRVRGLSIGSPVMSGWDGVELAPYLDDVTHAPLFVGNDADVLARSELLGGAGGLDDVLVVKASTGLGLGIIADGRVLSGHLGAAGEIGHTKVDAAGRAALPVRRDRLPRDARRRLGAGGPGSRSPASEVGHVRDLVALALQGDSTARGLLRDSGRELGEVLAIAINLLNPAAVVIGGDMAAAFDFYVAGVRESVYAPPAPLATRDLQFLPATHGDRAGLVGCAALALDHVLSPVAVDARLAAATRSRVWPVEPNTWLWILAGFLAADLPRHRPAQADHGRASEMSSRPASAWAEDFSQPQTIRLLGWRRGARRRRPGRARRWSASSRILVADRARRCLAVLTARRDRRARAPRRVPARRAAHARADRACCVVLAVLPLRPARRSEPACHGRASLAA